MLFDFVAQSWMCAAKGNYVSSVDSFLPETTAEFPGYTSFAPNKDRQLKEVTFLNRSSADHCFVFAILYTRM